MHVRRRAVHHLFETLDVGINDNGGSFFRDIGVLLQAGMELDMIGVVLLSYNPGCKALCEIEVLVFGVIEHKV